MSLNTLVRYGRPQDNTSLLNDVVPVLGKRSVKEHSRNALIVHTMKNFEVTYVLKGTLEWIINDEIIVTRPHDVLITHPNDKLAILENSFPISECFFMQVNPDTSDKDFSGFPKLLKQISSRKVSYGIDGSNPFKRLVEEHGKRDDFSVLSCHSLVTEILVSLVRQYRSGGDMRPGENSMLQKNIITFLEERLEQEISVGDMAEAMGYSESHFRSLFRKISNLSPVQFLQHLRIESAQRLIREQRLSLSSIASTVGFNSAQYFSNVFKKQVGLSPREYRSALSKHRGKETVHDQMTTIQVMDMHFPVKS